ncbi:MAG: hypothetical protein ACLFPX_01695 [Candidatus Omnitrophota bacterium]
MIIKRPFGIILISGVFASVGAVTTLQILFEIIDAVRYWGVEAIVISSPLALFGFFLYGCAPLIFYSLGVGLFSSRQWARDVSIRLVPPVSFFLIMNWQTKTIRTEFALWRAPLGYVFVKHPVPYFRTFFLWALAMLMIMKYLRSEMIRTHFHLAEKYRHP